MEGWGIEHKLIDRNECVLYIEIVIFQLTQVFFRLTHVAVIGSCIAGLVSAAKADDLFSMRNWTSTEGTTIKAKLLQIDGDSAELKLAKNGKNFKVKLPILSEQDRELIKSTTDKLDEKINSRSFGLPPKLSEKTLYEAFRLGKHENLWAVVAGKSEHNHIWNRSYTTGGVPNIRLILTPQRIEREDENTALIIGKYIAVRLILSNGEFKLSGDDLFYGRVKIAQKSEDYTPYIASIQKSLTGMKLENVRTSTMLVITNKVSNTRDLLYDTR